MPKAQKHPLDFDALHKGTWLETEDLEHATECKRDDKQWGLRLVALVDRIHREREDLVCRVDHDRIRVMDDLEADEYGYRRMEYHRRGIGRQAKMLLRVDPTGFDEGQKTLHSFRLRASLAASTAARSAVRKEKRRMLLGGGDEKAKKLKAG